MTRKTAFFEGWSWFKFNNLGLALGTILRFYTNVAKGLKLKVRKFLGLILTFVEVTGEKLVLGEGAFCRPPILNSVKHQSHRMVKHTQTIRRLLPPETLLYLNNHYVTNVEEQL